MVYTILKFLIRITLQFSYKRVEIIGREKIPKNKPVIFVSNHPSAYLEPIILATWIMRPLHFLINGNFWKVNNIFAWLLDKIHGVPIYKSEDGYNSVKDNEVTFQTCVDLIIKNNLLIIFAEGTNNQVRRLRRLKKGFAHIAYKTMEQHPGADVQIIPIGFVYSDPNILRGDCSVIIADPIPAQEYFRTAENTAVFAKNLLVRVEQEFNDLLPTITAEEELTFEEAMHLEASFGKPFIQQWKDGMTRLRSGDFVPRNDLVNALRTELWEQNLTFSDVVKSRELNLFHKCFLILGFIPAMLGKVLHYIPYQMSHTFVKKRIRKNEFYLSLRVVVLMLNLMLYYIVIKSIALFGFGTLAPAFLLTALGLFAIFYFDIFRIWKARKYQDRF